MTESNEILLFSDLLKKNDVDLETVICWRHAASASVIKDYKEPNSPYYFWYQQYKDIQEKKTDIEYRFDYYQASQPPQHQPKNNIKYIASFIKDDYGDTVFIGLYENHGLVDTCKKNYGKLQTPFWCSQPNYNDSILDLRLSDKLSSYIGKLVIQNEWASRNFKLYATSKELPILEIRKEVVENAFPGWRELVIHKNSFFDLPLSWKIILSQLKGIYLITYGSRTNCDLETYVGSANGENGFWERWSQHISIGTGDAIEMKNKYDSNVDFFIQILEVVPSGLNESQVVEVENAWKRKLQTTLNLN